MRNRIIAWIGGLTAIIGLVASLSGGVTWLKTHYRQHAELASQMAVAQGQAKQGDYETSIQSYADILKDDSLYTPALDQQLDATMRWVENFDVVVPEGQDPGPIAAPKLNQLFALLDAGLTRTTGPRAADVQAHLGWAHWLNQHIAEREFGPTAEQNFRAALQIDPTNVYANAMLGNWMLQNRKNFTEAVGHLNSAISTDKARPFARALQMGGLISAQPDGAAPELMKASNDMRKSNEPLDEHSKSRILFQCCTLTNHELLTQSLSALPEDDAWKTYLWLDDEDKEGDAGKMQLLSRDFINANLLEISGKRPEALAKYRTLQQQLKGQSSTLQRSVDDAIARLSHS